MRAPFVRYEQTGRIATVTMLRPDMRDAIAEFHCAAQHAFFEKRPPIFTGA